MTKYYLQDKRNYVGNCVLWWRINAAGYTTDIREAHVFTAEELRARSLRSTDVPWPKEYIDSIVRNTIDMQCLSVEEAVAYKVM